MKLTERQVKIRSVFRNYIIDNWLSPGKIFMFGAVIEVQKQLEIQSQQKAKDEMAEIPSIGWLSDNMAINVWAAKYFKPVANALWDGKSKDQVLALWAKTKRTTDPTNGHRGHKTGCLAQRRDTDNLPARCKIELARCSNGKELGG